MDRRDSTKQAIRAFVKRECAPQSTIKPKRQNKKPERDTEKAVLHWAKSNQIYLHVVESSSYDPRLGQKGIGKASAGMSDLIGNTPTGLSCYIELKAKGRRRNLSELQRLFLEQKIDQSCFAVVVDSVEAVQEYWHIFCSLKNPTERKEYLKKMLPSIKRKEKPARDDFEAKWGF